MNENKLARFLECGFVICYQHCKTCTYLNNHVLHSQGQIQREMEMKSDEWKRSERTHGILIQSFWSPWRILPRENSFAAYACLHKHRLVLSTCAREETEKRKKTRSFMPVFVVNSFEACRISENFLVYAHSQRLFSMKLT